MDVRFLEAQNRQGNEKDLKKVEKKAQARDEGDKGEDHQTPSDVYQTPPDMLQTQPDMHETSDKGYVSL